MKRSRKVSRLATQTLVAVLALAAAACSGGDGAASDSVCLEAHQAAAGLDPLTDSLDDFYPTLSACGTLEEWADAAEAADSPLDTSSPAFTVSNLCRGADDEYAGTPLCREAVAADPLSADPPSDAPPSQSLDSWRNEHASAMNALQQAGVDAHNSQLGDDPIGELTAACDALADALPRAVASVPVPDDTINEMLTEALRGYQSVHDACVELAPFTESSAPLVVSLATEANGLMDHVANELNAPMRGADSYPDTPLGAYQSGVVHAFTKAYNAGEGVDGTYAQGTKAYGEFVATLRGLDPPKDSKAAHRRAVRLFERMVELRRDDDYRAEDTRQEALDALYKATGLDYERLFFEINR